MDRKIRRFFNLDKLVKKNKSWCQKKFILLGVLTIMAIAEANVSGSLKQSNLSHPERNTLNEAIESITNKIRQRGDLPYVSMARQLELLKDLSQFGLGRFLLERGGLDGYWTNYVIHYPKQGKLSGLNSENQFFTALESFILSQAPVCLATQERFEIFKDAIQRRLYDGISLASIPCGLSADLLSLDFSQTPNFSIFGIDIDLDSLTQSKQIAEKLGISSRCNFTQKDAWNLESFEEFDLITSNGLSIYEPDNQKIVDLYQQFFLALKPNGYLITSFLTPPPIPGQLTEWDLMFVNSEHSLLQKILFSDILDSKWQVFRSEDLVRSQLLEAGFSEVEVIYDKAHIFPTAIAKKAKLI
jgi:SAM-dependent methyltransferase